MTTRKDLVQLGELLSSVVIPVIAALLPEDAVQEICIYSEDASGSQINLRIVAEGESFRFYVKVPGQAPESAEDLRHRLAEDL